MMKGIKPETPRKESKGFDPNNSIVLKMNRSDNFYNVHINKDLTKDEIMTV